jgi:hypothetical protein
VEIPAIIFGLVVITAFLAEAYVTWKVFTLYRLLGDRKKDIDFYSLCVWVLTGPTYASWRLGPQIKEFDDLPEELLKQLPLVRRQARPAKRFIYIAATAFFALIISGLFVDGHSSRQSEASKTAVNPGNDLFR